MSKKEAKTQDEIFQQARPIVEKIAPEIRDDLLEDQFTALTLMLAQVTVRMGKTTEEALEMINNNMPVMVTMWVNAYYEAKPPAEVC